MGFPDAPAFRYGDLVYHRTEETPGVVTGLIYREAITYEVTWQSRIIEEHQACELTAERPFFAATGDKEAT